MFCKKFTWSPKYIEFYVNCDNNLKLKVIIRRSAIYETNVIENEGIRLRVWQELIKCCSMKNWLNAFKHWYLCIDISLSQGYVFIAIYVCGLYLQGILL